MVTRFRFGILMIVMMGAYAYLGRTLYTLQIKDGAVYAQQAESQIRLASFLQPHRGAIYFTDKNNGAIPAAINKPYPIVFADPKAVTDLVATTRALAPIIGVSEEKVKMLLQKDNEYAVLVKKATPEQIDQIRALNINGIYIDSEESRLYRFNGLAAQVLGFVGPDEQGTSVIGKYGLELFYEDTLAGRAGVMKNKKLTKAATGEDITLTIDRDIQARAEEILAEKVKSFQATGGTVIVQEPKTGKILAMASYPSFDPNTYSQASIASFLNPAVQSTYEPGSVFKVLTMAAGLDTGAITPQTTYYDNGELKINDRTIRNWDLKSYGKMTMTEVIEHSLNIGAAFAEKKTGNDVFQRYVRQFGFGALTQINLPGEVVGDLRNLTDLRNPVNFATASFGQGISVTPLQLINAVSAIANGGHLMRPIITTADEPEELERVITPETAQQVTAMMENALEKAKVGVVAHHHLAGKTGTAQVPDFKHGGYTKDVINTYVGFGPVSDPRFIILFKLDKPAGAPLAGQTVVPAFRELAEFILNYYTLPPDDIGQ